MMVVLVVDNAPQRLRGEMTRWFLEVKPGVFVGKVNTLVKDELWNYILTEYIGINALLLSSANNEQGFKIQMAGDPKRSVVDFDGIQLIKIQ